MRILYINHYAGSPWHGMEFRPYYLARKWLEAGHDVRILAASFSHVRNVNVEAGRSIVEEEIDGVRYYWCRTPKYDGNGIGRFINILVFLFGVFRFYFHTRKDWRPDVVIASSTYPLDMLPAAYIAKRSQAELVYEVHDLWPLTQIELWGMSRWHPFIMLLQWAEDFAYSRADAVVSMLPCAKDYMVTRGMEPSKFVTIPNGIVLDDWNSGRTPIPAEHSRKLADLRANGYFIVGYAGSHGHANALDVVLSAAFILRKERVAFVFVGDGTEKSALVERAINEELENVHFFPSIQKAAIPNFLEDCNCLIIAWKNISMYRFGISPNKLFDYMMAGKAIVESTGAGNAPVRQADCGLTVEPENPAAIAEAVRTLKAMSAGERERLGANGRAYVLEHHEYGVLAKQFLDILRTPPANARVETEAVQ